MIIVSYVNVEYLFNNGMKPNSKPVCGHIAPSPKWQESLGSDITCQTKCQQSLGIFRLKLSGLKHLSWR